jgi:hypothetical protein
MILVPSNRPYDRSKRSQITERTNPAVEAMPSPIVHIVIMTIYCHYVGAINVEKGCPQKMPLGCARSLTSLLYFNMRTGGRISPLGGMSTRIQKITA